MMTQDVYISTLFKAEKFKKLIDFPSPTWYHVFLTMSLILCKQGQFRFKGFRLIIRKLYLLKEDILRCNTPLTKETTLIGINYMHYQSFTKWSCLRQFLSNFVHQCRLKDVNFNNWYNLDFF